MKSIIEKIYESSVSSKYDTTVFDISNYKNKKLIPSNDENKNFIIARLGRHFFWRLKGRSNKVDDYIESSEYNKYTYFLNIYNSTKDDLKRWESEKNRETVKIGVPTTIDKHKNVLPLEFHFGNNKLTVSCQFGIQQNKTLGVYDVEDNPIDREYEDPSKRYKK